MENNNTNLHKEIDLIQSCINRLSKNSFTLKGWLISLIAVIIALMPYKLNLNVRTIYSLVLCVTICFWYLDGFFLKQERLYRKKYEWIIVERPSGNINYLYDLNPNNKNMWLNSHDNVTIWNSIFSKTLAPFYGLTIFMSTVIFIFI